MKLAKYIKRGMRRLPRLLMKEKVIVLGNGNVGLVAETDHLIITNLKKRSAIGSKIDIYSIDDDKISSSIMYFDSAADVMSLIRTINATMAEGDFDVYNKGFLFKFTGLMSKEAAWTMIRKLMEIEKFFMIMEVC